MTVTNSSKVILYADREHAGVRYVVLAILTIIFIIGFLLLNRYLGSMNGTLISEYSLVLSCVGGLVLGLAFSGAGEYLLKKYWPSGRMVTLDEFGARATLPDSQQVTLDWSLRSYAIKWQFALKGFPRGGREKRIPASYYCLACQLQQDEERLIVYGYFPKKRAARWLDTGDYFEIRPGDFYDNNPLSRRLKSPDRPDVPASALTGKMGLYWMGERRRWEQGLELTADDFEIFIDKISAHVED
jgi:hypothetical protein